MYPGAHAESTPDKPAVVMAGSGEVVTYRHLNDRSNQLAQLLWKAGLRPGDTLALCLENNARYHEVLWAGFRSGLYITAISTRLTPSELAYILEDCNAKAFVTSGYKQEEMRRLADTTDTLDAVAVRLAMGVDLPGFDRYEDALAAQPAEPIEHETLGGRMLYSSGTTGRPKGIRGPLPEAGMETPDAVTLAMSIAYGTTPDSVYLSPAPLYHAAPLAWTLAVQRIGGTVVIMEHFDPVEFLRLVEAYRVTHTQVVPTMFVRMLKLPEEDRYRYDLSSLKYVIHAAAPCPVPVKEQMIAWWGPIIHEYYAGTEGNGSTAIASPEWLEHKGSVGQAAGAVIHICDEGGEELPAREPGTIYFESPTALSFEYHNDPEKTAAARHPKGWSTLGDIGYLDEEGYLYLTDRKANMIISGGVNIYPQEAENVLTMHPKVVDVAVFGVPNEDFGEEVKAVVQPVDMDAAGPELERELIAFCRAQLADLKCPRSIDFSAELPRHPTGKLYKRLLRDTYWQGHESKLV